MWPLVPQAVSVTFGLVGGLALAVTVSRYQTVNSRVLRSVGSTLASRVVPWAVAPSTSGVAFTESSLGGGAAVRADKRNPPAPWVPSSRTTRYVTPGEAANCTRHASNAATRLS